jgi:TPR repeat protein
MKHRALANSFLLYMLLTLFGCTSHLYFDRSLPAEVAVTDEQWKVVALNRYNPDLLPYKREKKVDVYHKGALAAFAGALDAIDADVTYQLVTVDSAAYASFGSQQDLTPAQVKAIYAEHPHHLLLSLDHFDAFFEQDVEQVEDGDGDILKIAHYTLVTKSSWTLYDSTGAVLDRVELSSDALYNSRNVISGLLAIGPAISNAGTVITPLAYDTGLDYWQRLSPQHISVVRAYYSSKNLQSAASSMAAADWDKAIAVLKPLAEGQSKKESARAAYNLAVIYEAKGDLPEARRWAKIASDKKDKLAMQLLPELEQYAYLR